MNRLSYNDIFLDAVRKVLSDYEEGRIDIRSEGDLQSHLFFWCRKLMEENNFQEPLKIYVEKSIFSKRKKIDLILGNDEVLVELKIEPDYPGVSKPVAFSTKSAAAGSGSVERDLEKISEYSMSGKCAHFLMIDEDGRHVRKINNDWKVIRRNGKTSHYLHVYLQPK